jgi:TonB family protein
MSSDRRVAALVLVLAAGCATAPYQPRRGVEVPIVPSAQPVEQLLANLRSPVAVTRAGAAWNLAAVAAPGDEVGAALDAALDDPDEKVREAAAWGLGHVTHTASGYDEPPRPLRITRPQYPRRAFDQKLEGMVDVEILIGEAGTVVHAEVRRSIPGLDQAALECVKAWTFTPARRKGRPIPASAQAPVTFRIT